MSTDLKQKQKTRDLILLEKQIDEKLFLIEHVSLPAKKKLKGILLHYAKSPHIFRSCVRDNLKRFGPGQTEKVCATIKQIITRSTDIHTKSRAGVPEIAALAQDREVISLLEEFTEQDLREIIGLDA